MPPTIIKVNSGSFKVPVMVEETESYKYLTFNFNRDLLNEIKASMRGARWMGHDEHNPKKAWRIDQCEHNEFRLRYMQGEDVYGRFEKPKPELEFLRPLMVHQKDLVGGGLTSKSQIWAAEPGLGKTLAAIELIERACASLGTTRVWYVGPKNGLPPVRIDFRKWQAKITPIWFTYEEMKSSLKNWTPGMPPPQIVIFDEAQKLKNESAQRTQAAAYLTKEMRKAYGDNCYIILMTGTPAPKSPADWYSLCEIAQPGFVREGNIYKFKDRLAIITQVGDVTGGRFPKLVAWRDGKAGLCNLCGSTAEDDIHNPEAELWVGRAEDDEEKPHEFTPMVDEISKLYRRMKGLAVVKLKKDCLDLPDKIYKQIYIKPSPEIRRAAMLIQAGARNTVTALSLLRELSDGFQYGEEISGYEVCEPCKGEKSILVDGVRQACPFCNAKGSNAQTERTVVRVDTPKLHAMHELIGDELEDENRLIIYAGFQASIDLVVESMRAAGWRTIKVDGRGWASDFIDSNPEALIQRFQSDNDEKIAFVAHPESGGVALTLTAAKAEIFYSNSFKGEDRMQAEDRIHRISSRGALYYDLIHLPSDQLVLDNIRRKRELQALTMGDIATAMENSDAERD